MVKRMLIIVLLSVITSSLVIIHAKPAEAQLGVEVLDADPVNRKHPHIAVDTLRFKMLKRNTALLGALGTASIYEREIEGVQSGRYQGEVFTSQTGVPDGLSADVKQSIIVMDVDDVKEIQKVTGRAVIPTPAGEFDYTSGIVRSRSGGYSFVATLHQMLNPKSFIIEFAEQYRVPGSSKEFGCWRHDADFTDDNFRFVSSNITVDRFLSNLEVQIKGDSTLKWQLGQANASRGTLVEVESQQAVALSPGAILGYEASAVCFDRDGHIDRVASDWREYRRLNRVKRPNNCRKYRKPRQCD